MKLKATIYDGPSLVGPTQCVSALAPRAEFEAGVQVAGVERLLAVTHERYGIVAPLGPDRGPRALAHALAGWTLDVLNLRRGNLEFFRGFETPDCIGLACEFHESAVTSAALRLAVSFARADLRDEARLKWVDEQLAALWAVCQRRHPNFESAILITAARARGVPFTRLDKTLPYWMFGHGARSRVFHESQDAGDGWVGKSISRDKAVSKRWMRLHGLPTLPHFLMNREEEAEEVEREIGYPCITKPLTASKRAGGTLNIVDREGLIAGFRAARDVVAGPVMVEPYFKGHEYRISVMEGGVVTAYQRRAPEITGDGVRSVRELVADLNRTRMGAPRRRGHLRPVPVDDVMEAWLARHGMTFDSVPEAGETLVVRNENYGREGGKHRRQDEILHPKLVDMVTSMTKALQMRMAGFDFITEVPGADPDTVKCAFLEVNAPASIRTIAISGWSEEEVGARIMGDLPARIPARLIVQTTLDDTPPVVAEGGAVCVGGMVHLPRRSYRCEEDGPWPAVSAAIRLSHVERLEIRATPQQIVTHGFPLERFDEIDLSAAALPSAWGKLAERIADRVLREPPTGNAASDRDAGEREGR